ncbi:MAG: ubiquinol oxidase subunit II [Chlamydiales bacterium]|nr:ubiquinol oxidase subunit II [Chlamydiales bacterium]
MREKKPVSFILFFSGFVLLTILLMQFVEIEYGGDIAVLFPRGIIALAQRDLLLFIQALMLLVVIPVYILTFVFSWKYGAHSDKAKYTPEWDHSHLAEYLWWGIPFFLVLIIGGITWIKTYELDPYKPIESSKKPLTIQVVALQWKWLFIYPEQNIASVNFVQFPEKTPINFEITADAPMNSFWIPQLGGQIYAMPKMKTKLYLIAEKADTFKGSSANLSGVGFAGMHFIAKASTEEDFHKWVESVKHSPDVLQQEEYNQLALPSSNLSPKTYLLKEEDLFNKIIMKYMHPQEKS